MISKKKRRLRIAQLAPLAEIVPPKKYGGTERIISTLTEELVRRGHDVTLFATENSVTSAKLVSVFHTPLREAKIKDPYGINEYTLLNIGTVYDMQESFDVIHDHLGPISLPVANISKTPVVMTIHGAFNPTNKKLYNKLRNPNIVAISKSQALRAGNANIVEVIHNGLSMNSYPFGAVHKGYLLFVGRLSMDKGVHFAIDAALELNLPLIIAAKLDSVDISYFTQYVEPRLTNVKIKWIGEVDEEERNKLMSEALAFIHPVTFSEPFGLSLIEAMACGCPVVAFGKGSIPEIIRNGKVGFVVNDVEEMIDAVNNIDKIDRSECRRYALSKFSAKMMTDKYEKLYYRIIEGA